MKNKIIPLLLCGCVLLMAACKKALNVQPQDKVAAVNAYQNLADADAGIIGIYGQFLNLAKPYILMNELRADLVDVTANANPYLQQITAHTETPDNPYIDPTPFYQVILNCNDVLKHFNIMVANKKISVDDYNQRYSDIAVLRSWIYLQLGIHYGNIPYITKPVENIDDIKNLNNFPKITFNSLLDSLLNFTTNLPYITQAQGYAYPSSNDLVVSTDGNNTRKMFINKEIFLGDLNLWKGNYNIAATNYKVAMVMESTNGNLTTRFDGFRVVNNSAENSISYGRYQEEPTLNNSTTSGWRSMFALPNTSSIWDLEWYWYLPYSSSYQPGNPFIELCSPITGKYLIKPSQAAIDMWNSQSQSNGIPYDARGILSYSANGISSSTVAISPIQIVNPAITKLTDAAGTLTALSRGGQWNIWRAGGVHLHFAEAANRDGQSKVAWALVNRGINLTYNPSNLSSTAAQLNLSQTYQPAPYDFDARYNNDNHPLWYRNAGVRGRADMPPMDTLLQRNINYLALEDKIIEEDGRELAFEGSRWSDLLRVSIRRNDPSFIADKIYSKLVKAGNPNAATTRARLMARDWYLPFKW